MYRYLGRNAVGYDSLRIYTLDNDVFPALLFDPHPNEFIIPKAQKEIQWILPTTVNLPANEEDLAFYSISQLATLIQTKQISAVNLTKLYLNRIKKYDPTLLAVTEITEERALQQAKKVDQEIATGNYKGLLHGIPYGVKDLMALKGDRTTWGAAPYKTQKLDKTASVIEKLDEAGAILIAKLTSGALAIMSLAWSMDKIGPMCRNAEDCAIVFAAIHGTDGKDKTVRDAAFNYEANIDLSKLKVGYLAEFFRKDSTSVEKNNKLALATFEKMGITPEAISFPKNFPYQVFDVILRAEAGAFFDDLVRSKGVDKMVQQDYRSRANSLRQARFIPAVEYLQANRHRKVLIEEMHKIFKQYDVIISPTFGGRQLLITNLTGHPAVALPNGFDKKGRPTSITLLGNLYDEAILLAMAKQFQAQTIFEEKHPPKFK